MTPLLFGAAGLVFLGYLIGKLFKALNPFLMLIGAILALGTSSAFLELEYPNAALGCFVFGAILNFDRPVTKAKYWLADLLGAISFRKAREGYVNEIEEQKAQAEAELYRQKQQVEEELRQQKRQAEEDLARQKREAEEELRRQAENFRREQERANKNQQSQNQGRQDNGQNSRQNQRSEYLNPRVFADACEILGMPQGKTLAEYKKAWRKLMSMYHSDKLAGLSEDLQKQEEEKAKLINAAWETIKKKFK